MINKKDWWKMKELKKEDIKDLSYKDITYLILEKEKSGINTLDLFTKIVSLLELPSSTIDSKIGDYYTSLTTDKRFLLVDGLWDLRNRHTSDKVLSSITDEEEEEESFEETDDSFEEEENFDEDSIDDDSSYEEDNDDGLSDLVVLDEDEMNLDNE